MAEPARLLRGFVLGLAAVWAGGCGGLSVGSRILVRNVDALARSPRPVPNRITRAERADVRLAVLWVGHATTLIQMDDKFILTDPVFTSSVGQLSPRLVEPGIDVQDLPFIDAAVVSHTHFDHLSFGTLDVLEPRLGSLLVPRGALAYVPRYRFPTGELGQFETTLIGDLRITAVPVKHVGGRYGVDSAWATGGFTGWVLEYHGMTVYFGGDTAYDRALFRRTAERFPSIDLAILPIAPVEPPDFARPTHLDGREAIRALVDLQARHMVPVHFDTFAHGVDEPGYATQVLRAAMAKEGMSASRVHILPIGGQIGFFATERPRAAAPRP